MLEISLEANTSKIYIDEISGFNPYYAGDQFRSMRDIRLMEEAWGFNPYYAGDQFRSLSFISPPLQL